jgi:peptidoglycan-associated lipoprotein
MKRFILISVLLILGGVLLLSGCAPKKVTSSLSDVVTQRSAGSTASGLSGTGRQDQSVSTKRGEVTEESILPGSDKSRQKDSEAGSVEGQKLPLELQDIFFEFDSYSIRQEDGPILISLSEWLAKNKSVKLSIEGHCDERGTTDYNLALGQKRSEAAKAYLVKLGVDEKRIKVLSYGKEVPVDSGHSETAWKKNRRAHFVAQQ